MALSSAQITSSILAARGDFNGVAFASLAKGIGDGVGIWAVGNPVNLSLTGVAAGTIGTGTMMVPSTKLLVNPGVGVVLGALAGAGSKGPLAAKLASVVGIGIAHAFSNYAQYLGTSAGVATGQDVSVVTISNSASLISILMGTLAGAFGAGGASLPRLATGLGNGIAAMLLGATGTGTIVGTPGPAPGTGATNSVVV